MEKLFVKYDIALRLRDLGFDEPCIARFIGKQFSMNVLGNWYRHNSNEVANKFLSAPTYQQAFMWVSQKLNLSDLDMPLNEESQITHLTNFLDYIERMGTKF